MAELKLANLQKEYNGHTVIQGINLVIPHGEFVVIVGPSGCGKSSILRMIAGLEEVTSGEIYIDRKNVNQLEPKDRNIAMVFQNYALYPHMTVYNNMAYALRMRGIPKKEIAERVAKTAESLQLGELLQRYPSELSGGQRQRVAMGRALIRKPDIFLFDEPLSNLDAKLRVQMRLEIKRLQNELNITSVYVTHDQVEAMTLADRLVLIKQGRIEQIGTPMAVYQRPASIFAAGFLGSPSMNFMSGCINKTGTAVELSKELQFPLSDPRWQHYAEQPVTVGLRPEHLVHREEATSQDIHLHVDMVETLGADSILYGTLDGVASSISARLPGLWRLEPRERFRLAVMPDALHIFDNDTGMRL